ncbi:DUF4893 domain-containing protein [uncultured Paracoccus sp.]|uniref:DUF4893 domain-containing protein n=1 Tax=uncultured Paracoccus sp. TaxID=189685 RepID=UPI00261A364E|nr:DUF4893 domain-containing protein [uncultured Paracoccus sp.]
MPRLTALALLAALAAPAHAQSSGDANPEAAVAEDQTQRQLPDGSTLRADDLRRLNGADRAYGAALRQAMADAAPGDLDRLLPALRGAPMPAAEALAAMPGDWSCQMMKVGGGLALTIYQPFACRADDQGGFQKLTGSQRTKGKLFEREGRLIYVGTGYTWDREPIPYADLPEVVDGSSDVQMLPEVGVVELTGADRGRILFPDPYLESVMNVLVLRR